MLEELRIRDLGVITDATLPLGPGLSVVTGETGAGKTMVVTAVGLLLGARSDAGAVRSGAKSASAEAVLKLDAGHAAVARAREAGAEVEEFDGGAELLLARSVGADGRSRAFLGGRAAPVGVLAEIGETLVVVHGQSDQIRLKSPVAQRGALDKFAGDGLARNAGRIPGALRSLEMPARPSWMPSAAPPGNGSARPSRWRLPWPRSTPSTRSRGRTMP